MKRFKAKEESSLKIKISINKEINIYSTNIKDIIQVFRESLRDCFQQIVHQVLVYFAHKYVNDGTISRLLKCSSVTWKTSKGASITSILTIFGKVQLPQLQVKNGDTGKRIYITRLLLGIKPYIRIPLITIKVLGLIGSLASYRVVRKIADIFTSAKISLMTIMRSIRKTGKMIDFKIDRRSTNIFEGDGTGIPILNIKKRGKELCVLAQRKRKGGIRIAGMNIASYKKGWKKLFEPLKESLKKFKEIFLITDGDTSPLEGLSGIKVILQRCLFHIAHETKYTLWKDKVKRKSKEWCYILSKILDITNVKRIREEEGVAKNIIKGKRNQFTRLINYCRKNGYCNTKAHLQNAKGDLFSGIERKVLGGTTSLIERVMRTINMRINIAKWTTESALAVCKIRGAYYYNGFDVL
jgi:hypothetical protein